MPVIVNELEVVVESPDGAGAAPDAAPPAPATAAPLTPLALAEVLERRARIDARVLAH
jgi:hypothetical protein